MRGSGEKNRAFWVNFLGAALILAVIPAESVAESGSNTVPQPRDFTFRRVKVADSLPGRRITVQIDPKEQAELLALLPKVDADLPAPAAEPALGPRPSEAAQYSWFWDTVPAGLDEVSGRFPLALTTINKGPDGQSVPAPRMQFMQGLAATYGTEILKATIGTEVSPALALAVMYVESAGEAKAVSGAGAQGLMQLIPATAARFGVIDALDADQNIKGGIAYLDWLMGHFNRDPIMVIAAYNAGEGAITANRGVPPYAETRDYVPKVLAAWQVAQGLCMTPPELMTDPCVFRVQSAVQAGTPALPLPTE